MTINPIKIIRDRKEYKAYLKEEEALLRDQRVRNETIEWMVRENLCKPSVS